MNIPRAFKLTATVLLAAVWVPTSLAQTSFKFVSINYPNSATTSANGINNYGSIVGAYQDNSGIVHGFKLKNSVFSKFDYPGANTTVIQGINDNGDLAGWYKTASSPDPHGFLYHNGTFKKIDVPNAPHGTMVMGINKYGTMVGRWLDVTGNYHGFYVVNGALVKSDLNGNDTSLNGISNVGVRVGQVFVNDFWQSFLKAGSDVDYLIDPRDADNVAYGVNGRADVVGCATASGSGFVLWKVEGNESSETNESLPTRHQIAYPNAKQTCAAGINYNRSIVGTFVSQQNHMQGFLAIPQ